MAAMAKGTGNEFEQQGQVGNIILMHSGLGG